jgi:hypothetical protein
VQGEREHSCDQDHASDDGIELVFAFTVGLIMSAERAHGCFISAGLAFVKLQSALLLATFFTITALQQLLIFRSLNI